MAIIVTALAAAACAGTGDPDGASSTGSTVEALSGTCDPARAAGAVSPFERALLDMIAIAEGTQGHGQDGYNIFFGFGQFSDCTQHPNVSHCSGSLCSTAAGRYQFLTDTWRGLRLPNFFPDNQDRGAMQLVRNQGRFVPTDRALTRDEFLRVLGVCGGGGIANTWASLPPNNRGLDTRIGCYPGQSHFTPNEAWNTYSNLVAGIHGGAGADGCTAQQRDNCGHFGCACVNGGCNGGYCPGTGCTAQEEQNCGAFGTQCVDHQCNGGWAPGPGCTAREQLNCAAFGTQCVDHQCNGGYAPGTGCTALEAHNCAAFGTQCVDHKCNGGYAPGTGCTALETLNCGKFGVNCVDHQCNGGFGPGTGCTALETQNCGSVGCGCVDHGCSGGFCPGTGCTAREELDCQAGGRDCRDHHCL